MPFRRRDLAAGVMMWPVRRRFNGSSAAVPPSPPSSRKVAPPFRFIPSSCTHTKALTWSRHLRRYREKKKLRERKTTLQPREQKRKGSRRVRLQISHRWAADLAAPPRAAEDDVAFG